MPRKFRLCRKKKHYPSPTSLTVSVPLNTICLSGGQDQDDCTSLPVSLPLSMYTRGDVQSLECLEDRSVQARLLPHGWIKSTTLSDSSKIERLTFCKLATDSSSSAPIVIVSLQVDCDFTWNAFLYGKKLNSLTTLVIKDMPKQLTNVQSLSLLLNTIDCVKLCMGNPDESFKVLLPSRKGVFRDSVGTVVAQVDNDSLSHQTIRHAHCELLLPSSTQSLRCVSCKKFRNSLRSLVSRHTKKELPQSSISTPAATTSHVNYRYLSTPEKDQRLRGLHTQYRCSAKKAKRLEEKIKAMIEDNGEVVDEEMNSDLKQIMHDCSEKVTNEHPEGSLPRVFWEQQLKAASCADKRQMRWHPVIVKWCLYLRHQSRSAYETLRSSGCISLPSQRTLRDYTHYNSTTIGFSDEVDKHLIATADMSNLQEYQKAVVVVMDEMHIREGLVYDKHSGALVGFTDLGDVNNLLANFDHSLSEEPHAPRLSKTMLVFMVRGLFTKLQFPYAQFAATTISGDQIFSLFWECVMRLERGGFMVLAATADGASPNRAFMNIHKPSSSDPFPYKVLNPFAINERHIHFISDPPHLLKTVRNCWSSQKRRLWCNGKEILWSHLRDLYYRDSGKVKVAGGLSLVPKLKYEHIHLTSFSKMRVDLAAQVLSSSVAQALRLTGGEEVTETAKFADMFDKMFDCLNVSNFSEGKKARKPFKDPWRKGDLRLKWLEEEFLPYLSNWESSVRARKEFSVAEQNKMLLSIETRLGLEFTVKSFIDLVKHVFTLPGVTGFLSERISQDPLEKFFGLQRQRGRVNENPNVAEFCKNTQALRVINCSCLNMVKGNCRGSQASTTDWEKENQPLNKRKATRKNKAK